MNMPTNKLMKVFFFLTWGLGSQAYAYTLKEAVSHTLATSPDFLITTNTRETVDKQLRESYAGYLPSLDMAAGWGQQYSNNSVTRSSSVISGGSTTPPSGTRTLTRTEFSLVASQMLFDGLGVYHDVEGHKARVRAESWRVNGVAQDTALNAIEAYLNVNLRKELAQVTKDNLAAHERTYLQIQKRSEGGIGRKADLDQAEARVALARTNLMAEEANLRDAETEFLRKIGIPAPTHLVQPNTPQPFPHSAGEAVELGLKQHPILRASVEDVMVTKEAHKGSRAPFSPRLDLQLGMNRNHNLDGNLGDSDDNYAMLRVRWNLFNGGKDLAKVCETAYQMQEAQEVQNRAHRQVVETVRLAWSTYETASKQMPYFKEHVAASLRTRDAYQKQFNIGQRTLLDLLDAENELFGARAAHINGRYTELKGMFRVLNATGHLTQSLGIALPYQAEPRPTGVMDGAARFFDKSTTLFDS